MAVTCREEVAAALSQWGYDTYTVGLAPGQQRARTPVVPGTGLNQGALNPLAGLAGCPDQPQGLQSRLLPARPPPSVDHGAQPHSSSGPHCVGRPCPTAPLSSTRRAPVSQDERAQATAAQAATVGLGVEQADRLRSELQKKEQHIAEIEVPLSPGQRW